jgi:hypothetical protein
MDSDAWKKNLKDDRATADNKMELRVIHTENRKSRRADAAMKRKEIRWKHSSNQKLPAIAS